MNRFAHLHIPEKYRKVQQRRGLILFVCFMALVVAIVPIITLVAVDDAPPCCWRASIVVCAVDNCDACGCDYTCDGTADQAEINAAIQDLVACGTGGEVLLTEGTFTINKSIAVENNIRLQGSGYATVIEWAENDISFAAITNADHTNGNSKIIIAELLLDGDDKGYGIFFDGGVTDSLIDTVWAQDGSYGIYFQGGVSDLNERINIVGCTLTSNSRDGGYFRYAIDCSLSGNFIYSNTLDGGSFDSSTGCALAGNIVRDNNGDGLYFSQSSYCSLMRNVVYSNGASTVNGMGMFFYSACEYNELLGNIVYDNYLHGVGLSGFCHHNLVEGNMVAGNGRGGQMIWFFDNIWVYQSDYNAILNNLCHESDCAALRYGINISDAASDCNMVEGNDLTDAGVTGNFNDSGTGTGFRDNWGNVTCGWLPDNQVYLDQPIGDYEVQVVDGIVEFAKSYIVLPELNSTQEDWLRVNTSLRIDPWNGGQRFVLFDTSEEEVLKELAKGNITAVARTFKDHATDLRDNYNRDFDSRVATRSQAIHYLENKNELTPQMRFERIEEIINALGITP